MGESKNGWLIMENPLNGCFGGTPFQETTTLYEDDCHISGNQHISGNHHMMFVFMRIMMNHH
jgi:hypothetical protein